MIDCILKLPDAEAGLDRMALKKGVAALFGDRHDGERSRYLFSMEPRHDGGPWVRVRYLDGELPRSAADYVQALPKQAARNGDRVCATAWVAVKNRNYSPDKTAAERVRGELKKLVPYFAEAMTIEAAEIGDRVSTARFQRGRVKISRGFGKVVIVGEINNIHAMERLLATGVGAAKAYGYGLIDIQTIEGT